MVYAQAYIMLDTERQYLDNIPWSKYVAYGQYYGFTRDQIDWLIEIGSEVDKHVLKDRASKSGKSS